MTLFKHELKRGALSLLIWTAAIAGFLGLCVLIYPQMAAQMSDVTNMFANMGAFSAAFGMDRLNFGELLGFFAVECGNILGIGGALFAAFLGIQALAREEKEKTADFLLTHPLSRRRVITEKLVAILCQLLILNAAAVAVTALTVTIIGEKADVEAFALLFLANFLMQVELASITFGISAFLRRNGLGIGIGLAALSYFMNILANLVEKTKFLKYFTPFGFADSSSVVIHRALTGQYLAVGMAFAALGIAAAYWKYQRKDIS